MTHSYPQPQSVTAYSQILGMTMDRDNYDSQLSLATAFSLLLGMTMAMSDNSRHFLLA